MADLKEDLNNLGEDGSPNGSLFVRPEVGAYQTRGVQVEESRNGANDGVTVSL